MRAVGIDFAPTRRRPGVLAVCLVLAGLGVFAGALREYSSAFAAKRLLERQVADARRTVAAAARAQTPALALSEPAIAAINEAIDALSLPWGEIFSTFERGVPKNVALLALEPDVHQQRFTVQAEAKSAEDMLDFFSSLDAGRRFSEVTLLKHEFDAQAPNRPIRFTLQARWQEGR